MCILLRPLSALLAALLCSVLLLTPSANATGLNIVTESLPPLNYEENGIVTGFATELVQAILLAAELKAPITLLPWARAYQLTLSQPNTLLYSTTRNAEREALFEWIGPISARQIFLYKLKARSDIHLNTIADSAHYRLGLVREMASTKDFLHTYAQADSQLDFAPTVESNLKKLLIGRTDLIISQDWGAAFLMKSQQRRPEELEAVFLLDGSSSYYLAMNKQSDPALVQKIRKGFEKVQQSGVLEKLRKKYLL